MDALEQLTGQVIPTLIAKMQGYKARIDEQEQRIVDLETGLGEAGTRLLDLENVVTLQKQQMKDMSAAQEDAGKALGKMYEAMKQYKLRLDILEARLEEKPAPDVKVRRSRKKKTEEAAAPKGERYSSALIADITGDDIISANYALAATKGDIDEACVLMPDVDRHKMELIAGMCSAQMRDIVKEFPVTVTNIDFKYGAGRWDEVD